MLKSYDVKVKEYDLHIIALNQLLEEFGISDEVRKRAISKYTRCYISAESRYQEDDLNDLHIYSNYLQGFFEDPEFLEENRSEDNTPEFLNDLLEGKKYFKLLI